MFVAPSISVHRKDVSKFLEIVVMSYADAVQFQMPFFPVSCLIVTLKCFIAIVIARNWDKLPDLFTITLT